MNVNGRNELLRVFFKSDNERVDNTQSDELTVIKKTKVKIDSSSCLEDEI